MSVYSPKRSVQSLRAVQKFAAISNAASVYVCLIYFVINSLNREMPVAKSRRSDFKSVPFSVPKSKLYALTYRYPNQDIIISIEALPILPRFFGSPLEQPSANAGITDKTTSVREQDQPFSLDGRHPWLLKLALILLLRGSRPKSHAGMRKQCEYPVDSLILGQRLDSDGLPYVRSERLRASVCGTRAFPKPVDTGLDSEARVW
jgi:hypothetical protein